MTLLKNINNHILAFYDKIVSFFTNAKKKKYFMPLVFVGVFLIVFAFFLIFTYSHPIYEGQIYQFGHDWYINRDLENAYRNDFLNKLDTTYILITGLIIIAILFLIFIYLLINKRVKFPVAVIFIISIGLVIRLIYMGYCDAIFKNQHDVWGGYTTGHLGITFSLFYTGKVPPLFEDFNMSYQFYHFKTAHVIFAGFMQFMKIFVGENQYILYQSLKIVSTMMSFGILVLTYFILKELNLTKRSLIFALILTISFPTLVILGANTNNDTALFFFTYLSIYFAIKFYKNHSWFNIIFLAISLGLTVSTKLSGALIALPIGVMMFYVLFKSIKEKTFKHTFITYVVFALICFPIGLSWGIINKEVYGYPLTYVWQVTNSNLMVEHNILLDRLLFIDLHQLFANPHVVLSNKNPGQTYNFFDFLIKSQLFGEWSLTKEYKDAAIILVTLSFVFLMLLFFLAMYFIFRLVIKKQYSKMVFYVAPIILTFGLSCMFGSDIDKIVGLCFIGLTIGLYVYYFLKKQYFVSTTYLAMFSIIMVYFVSYVYFNMKEPFVCTMDIRYMVPVLLSVAYFFSVYLDRFITQYSKSLKNN